MSDSEKTNNEVIAQLMHVKLIDQNSEYKVFISKPEEKSQTCLCTFNAENTDGLFHWEEAYRFSGIEVCDYCMSLKCGIAMKKPETLTADDFDSEPVKKVIAIYFGFTDDEVAAMTNEDRVRRFSKEIRWHKGLFVTLAPITKEELAGNE